MSYVTEFARWFYGSDGDLPTHTSYIGLFLGMLWFFGSAWAIGRSIAAYGQIVSSVGFAVVISIPLTMILFLAFPFLLAAVVPVSLWFLVMRLSSARYRSKVASIEKKRAEFLESADFWQRTADDPDQIQATREAASATAKALREQAKAIRALPIAN